MGRQPGVEESDDQEGPVVGQLRVRAGFAAIAVAFVDGVQEAEEPAAPSRDLVGFGAPPSSDSAELTPAVSSPSPQYEHPDPTPITVRREIAHASSSTQTGLASRR